MSWRLFPAAGARWIAAMVLLAFAPATYAGIITVTSLADTVDAGDGVTTLREAIIEAEATPGPDTIRFGVTGQILITGASPLPTITALRRLRPRRRS